MNQIAYISLPLLLSAVVGFLFLVFGLLFWDRYRGKGIAVTARQLMSFILLCSSYLFLLNFLIRSGYIVFIPQLIFTGEPVRLLMGALILLLAFCLTRNERSYRSLKVKPIFTLYLIPFFLDLGILYPGFILPNHDKISVITTGQLVPAIKYLEMNPLFHFYVRMEYSKLALALYTFAALVLFIHYWWKNHRTLSSQEKRILIYAITSVLVLLFLVIEYALPKWLALPNMKIINGMSVIEPISVLILLMVGAFLFLMILKEKIEGKLVQADVKESAEFRRPESIKIRDLKYGNNALDQSSINEILQQTEEFMKSQKCFLDGELTLTDLANRIGVTNNQLSQVINVGARIGFADYVNNYRIKHAVELLKEKNKKHSIIDIALESGFNSKTPFYNAFKKNLKMSPSQFIKQN
jgi:AraC-like DNA-binding protein